MAYTRNRKLQIKSKVLSSMEKVFQDQEPKALVQPLSFLQGEIASFQIAVNPEIVFGHRASMALVPTVVCDLPATIRMTAMVPVGLTTNTTADGRFLRTEPGLFPDPLMTADDWGEFNVLMGAWTGFLVEVDTKGAKAGKYNVTVNFDVGQFNKTTYETFTVTQEIEIIGAELPKQTTIYTSWFHNDALTDYYRVDVFSEEHWKLAKAQMEAAVRYGQNMILVPMFTPPLDTNVGSERKTVQTVDVTVTNGKYSFGFDNFDRYIRTAREAGMEYFEMSHLFTQWGGTSCPKIMATVDGEYKRIFGWDVESTSEEYQAFLRAFLPTLLDHMKELDMEGKAYFHLTDEPHGDHLERYLRLKNIVKPLIGNYKILDALSDYDFFYSGACEVPAVGTSHLKPFLEGKRPEDFWAYYCTSQCYEYLSNRHLAMPGYRTRILGFQLYKENINGFLQWGLNFYYSRHSQHMIDPYMVTDGEYAWPAGDPFVLYPGYDGTPRIALRLITFNEGLQDQRALQLLEKLTSREHVLDILKEEAGYEITFNDYPVGEEFILNVRNRVNKEIADLT